MAKAIEQCARVLIDMIPVVYDTQRVVKIINRDGDEEDVPVNWADGVEIMNRLDAGKYTVRVSVGPNYSTRRQETAESMLRFVQAVPAAGQVAADLIASAMDWPDADRFAERLKKLLPPGVADNAPPEAVAAAQQQAALEAQKKVLDVRKAEADAVEAEADAAKAQAEAMEQQLDLLMKSGAFEEMVARAVEVQLARLASSAEAEVVDNEGVM